MTPIHTNSNIHQFLKFIAFKDLEKWYVSYYINPYSIKSEFPLVRIGDLIKPKKIKIKKTDFKNDIDIVSKISFSDGKIHIREDRKTGMDLYDLAKGDLLVSKINFHQGALAINDIGTLVCSTHYQPYVFKDNRIDPDFFIKVVRSNGLKNFLNYLRAEGIKNEATYEFIGSIEIPLPSLSEQEEILADYNAKMQEAERLKLEFGLFNETYENTLFDFLGITKIPVKLSTNSLQFINLFYTSRWGYQYLLNHEQSERLLDTKKYPQNLLSNLVLLNPTTSFSELKKDDKISFLPMECVSDLYGEVIEYRDGDVQSSGGYTRFQEGDLLWSKITPCMQNGKNCIVENLENGFGYGSTEYHVIRAKEDSEIELRFLYHLLRTKYVLTNATFHFTGSAGQQRVPIEFLANLNVPLPSIDEQKEISKELDKLIAERKAKQMKVTELKAQAISDFEAKIFKN